MNDQEQREFDKNLENLRLELRRGTLVLGVLSRLQRPQYGYSLVEELGARGIAAEAGTLYPLLRRLEAQQLLESVWETSGPKPRKYYVLTAQGKVMLGLLTAEWQEITKNMIGLLREE
ncbi:MAG: PadR family transcriptional regulator [Sphaerochaetaceae bacterium]|jgi:DNA-binding PadR family transcriptional regulator|nr:PadR family transcriptional regulator [Sphaerochaetaceae bacterium]MDD3941367.1 PadR family transcriptional regulator [Sphaerochaetaceae bacterium]MDX9938414.1 PadR family transcriptional regulator [Sphaerochaetaceae bacterium]